MGPGAVLGGGLGRGRVSGGLVVTHVPDLRGEGEMLSVRPPAGPSQGRRPGSRLHRSAALLLSGGGRSSEPGSPAPGEPLGVWPGSAGAILPAFPRWPSPLAQLPLGPLSVNPEKEGRGQHGSPGLPAPCWGWRGLVPDPAPQTFQIPRIGCKKATSVLRELREGVRCLQEAGLGGREAGQGKHRHPQQPGCSVGAVGIYTEKGMSSEGRRPGFTTPSLVPTSCCPGLRRGHEGPAV